jgi:hypothetical protein
LHADRGVKRHADSQSVAKAARESGTIEQRCAARRITGIAGVVCVKFSKSNFAGLALQRDLSQQETLERLCNLIEGIPVVRKARELAAV